MLLRLVAACQKHRVVALDQRSEASVERTIARTSVKPGHAAIRVHILGVVKKGCEEA